MADCDAKVVISATEFRRYYYYLCHSFVCDLTILSVINLYLDNVILFDRKICLLTITGLQLVQSE